jgi:hypothetical protein
MSVKNVSVLTGVAIAGKKWSKKVVTPIFSLFEKKIFLAAFYLLHS